MPVYKANYQKLKYHSIDGFIVETLPDGSQIVQGLEVEITQEEDAELVRLMKECELDPGLLPEVAWFFHEAKNMASAANTASNYVDERLKEQNKMKAYYEEKGYPLSGYDLDNEQVKSAVKDYKQLLKLIFHSMKRIRIDLKSDESLDIKSEAVLQYLLAIIRQSFSKHDRIEYTESKDGFVEIVDHTLFNSLETMQHMTEKGKNTVGISQSHPHRERKKFTNRLYQFLILNTLILDYSLFRFIAQLMIKAGFIFPVQLKYNNYAYKDDPEIFTKHIDDLLDEVSKANRKSLNQKRQSLDNQ